MLMIVSHHFVYYGGLNLDTISFTMPELWYYLLNFGGRLGVALFVMITGYFLVTSKFSLNKYITKILKLLGQVIFYGIILTVICGLINSNQVDFKLLIKSFLPISHGLWWFISAYLVLFIFHPFLNLFINKISKKTGSSVDTVGKFLI